MSKKIRTVLAAAALIVATYATAAEMNGSHPDTYVVQKGDTLWDISGKFLEKPWLWPEIWQANPQIQNPHLIYPGDVLSLAYTNRVAPGVAVQPGVRQEAPIGAVPLKDIEPFLKNLRITDSFEELPRVVALETDRMRSSGGQKVYTLGLDGAQVGQRFAIVRPTMRYTQTRPAADGEFRTFSEDLDYRGQRVRSQTMDWDRSWNSAALDDGKVEFLGYELAQVSVGTLTAGVTPGSDTATITLEGNGHEVRRGDRLIPVQAQPYDLQFMPHVPTVAQPEGRLQIAAVANAMTSGGPRDVVAISGGSREGIDNGTVFSIWRKGSHIVDRMNDPEDSRPDETRRGQGDIVLPDEYAGHVMVFRTFDKVSYGLVMEGTRPSRVGYSLKHPDATY